MIALAAFQTLPTAEIARRVRAAGPKVCVFPINGTRRWFFSENKETSKNLLSSYLDATTKRTHDIIRLFFDHGLATLLMPCLSSDVIGRGDQYMQMAAKGLIQLLTDPDFAHLCQTYEIGVRFYGDYRNFFESTLSVRLSDMLNQLMTQTRAYNQYRLFLGLFAHNPLETVATTAVRFYQEHGYTPNREQLIEAYYGEYIAPVDLYIGYFDPSSPLDLPLIATGQEDLYFSINPSLYFNERQLRTILYDHLYTRHGESDYATLCPDDWAWLRSFYRTNLEQTLGVGARQRGIWVPLPQVTLLAEEERETRNPLITLDG